MKPTPWYKYDGNVWAEARSGAAGFGWFFLGLALIGGLGLVVGVPIFGGMLTVVPMVLALLCITALSSALRGTRRRRADAVLGHVSTAILLGLPLPAYLTTVLKEGQRPLQNRLRQLKAKIESGVPISRALSRVAGELPLTLQYQIAAAEGSGTLAQSLPRLLLQEQRRTITAAKARADLVYVLILITVLSGVGLMITIFVIPKFVQIFHDFGVQLPYLAQMLAGSFALSTAMMIGLIPLLLLLCGFLARTTRGLFTSNRTRSGGRWLSDRILWRLPVFGQLIRQRESAAVCETLHDALINGRPLPEAIELATLPSLNAVLRKRMVRWHERVERGEPPAAAARASRMPRLLCDLLAGARNDTAGAIAFAGRAYGSRSERMAIVIRAATPIVTTLVFAILVGTLALTMFQPMIALVDTMTGRGRP